MAHTLGTNQVSQQADASSVALATRPLESFRNYLMLLVETSFDASLSNKLEPADVVQETLLKRISMWTSSADKASGNWPAGSVKYWLAIC